MMSFSLLHHSKFHILNNGIYCTNTYDNAVFGLDGKVSFLNLNRICTCLLFQGFPLLMNGGTVLPPMCGICDLASYYHHFLGLSSSLWIQNRQSNFWLEWNGDFWYFLPLDEWRHRSAYNVWNLWSSLNWLQIIVNKVWSKMKVI